MTYFNKRHELARQTDFVTRFDRKNPAQMRPMTVPKDQHTSLAWSTYDGLELNTELEKTFLTFSCTRSVVAQRA